MDLSLDRGRRIILASWPLGSRVILLSSSNYHLAARTHHRVLDREEEPMGAPEYRTIIPPE